jgi:type III pantothenate kinase
VNLIIDIGNTRIKVGLFDQNELKHFFIFEHNSVLKNVATNPIINLFANYPIDNCIAASVVNDISPFIKVLETIKPVVLFTNETHIPLKNLYKSSNTLGSDRLAAAIGGNCLFPKSNTLVIDAGILVVLFHPA